MSFLTPKVPAPPPPPPPVPTPTIDDAAVRGAQEADALRRRQGRASTVLSGNQGAGAGGPVPTATKALLGS